MNLPHRILSKIKNEDGCYYWTGQRNRDGYGRVGMMVNGKWKMFLAHRVVYEAFFEKIPEGFQLDHLCRNPACVTPWHLEVVTSRENTLRGFGRAARNARKTHCKNGHPLSGRNLSIMTDGGRRCLRCHADKERTRRRVTHA